MFTRFGSKVESEFAHLAQTPSVGRPLKTALTCGSVQCWLHHLRMRWAPVPLVSVCVASCLGSLRRAALDLAGARVHLYPER